jgi:chromosome segregation ATPase
MRKRILASLAAFFLVWPLAAQQQAPPSQESVAEAARKAREKKKEAARQGRVFTNDNLPAAGGKVSVLGEARAPKTEKELEEEKKAADAATSEEAEWRAKFADANLAIRQAEKELDLLQRELNLLRTQYYSDPQKTLTEEFSRRTINEHQQKIEAKQKELQQLKQRLSDLEDELRRAGKPAAWARVP